MTVTQDSTPRPLTGSPPPVLKALLVLGFATGALHLTQALLGLANVASDPRVSWSGYEGWQLVPMMLFGALLPTVLIAGVVGLWRRKPGGCRLTVLAAGVLIALGVLQFGQGLVTFVRAPQATVHAGASLAHLVQTLLADNGVLLLLVIALRSPGDARAAPTPESGEPVS